MTQLWNPVADADFGTKASVRGQNALASYRSSSKMTCVVQKLSEKMSLEVVEMFDGLAADS